MKGKRFDFISFTIAIINIIAALIVTNYLPKEIPMHYNIYGQADRIAGKAEFFYFSFVPMILFLIFYLLTYTDKRLKEDFKPYWIICRGAILLIIIAQYSMLLSINSNSFKSQLLIEAIGAALILMGIYIPRLKQNTVAGFRLPWTLKDEENWKATHRFGGRLSIVIGFISIITGLILPVKYGFVVIFTIIILWTIAIVVYSYLYYRKNKIK
jgi:Predicted integral membrane protein